MHGKWETIAARVYYTVGLSYYLYNYLLLAGLGSALFSIITHSAHRNYIAISLIPFSMSFLIWGVVLWSKKRSIQYGSHNPGLEEKSTETTYTILANNQYHFIRKLEVKALHDGIDHYVGKFRWSGGLDVRAIEPVSAPHRVTVSRQPHDIHMICRVDFENPLRKNETLTFSYAFDMTDHDGLAEDFLSHSIYYRTDRIISRVRFDPPRENLRFYRRWILASATADMPIYKETVTLGENENQLEWDVKRPRFGYRYKLIW